MSPRFQSSRRDGGPRVTCVDARGDRRCNRAPDWLGRAARGGVVLIAAAALGGCGSSGSSNGNGNDYNTEFNQNHLEAVNALPENWEDWADGAGFDRAEFGDGTTVAVIDTGARAGHNELQGRVSGNSAIVEAGEDPDTTNVNDGSPDGRGTHISSMAVGENVGVAPGSTLLAIRAGNLDDSTIRAGMDYAREQNADVVNLGQLGDPLNMAGDDGAANRASAQSLAEHNTAIILDAGAEGLDSPEHVNLDELSSELKGHLLVVGAWNPDTRDLAGWTDPQDVPFESNAAGDAAERYLMAPGLSVSGAGIVADDHYRTLSGTPISTGIVSGAVAALIGQWEHLKDANDDGEMLALNLLLETANQGDEAFADYDEEVHGQGLLDLEAAFRAEFEDSGNEEGNGDDENGESAGAAMIQASGPVNEGEGASLMGSQLVLGSAFGDALQGSSLLSEAVVFDRWGRDFNVDLAPGVNTLLAQSPLSRHMDHLTTGGYSTWTDPEGRLSTVVEWSGRTFRPRLDDRWSDQGTRIDRLSVTGETGALSYGFHGASESSRALSQLDWSPVANQQLLTEHGGTSYLQHAEELGGSEFGWALTDGLSVVAGGWYGELGDTPAGSPSLWGARTGVVMQPVSSMRFALSFSQYHEDGSLLGSTSAGALHTGGSATTQAVALDAAWQPASMVRVFGRYEQGRTSVDGDPHSVVRGFDNLRSDTFSLGAVSAGDGATQVGMLWSQPLRINNGTAQLDVPVGRDVSGNVLRQQEDADVTPSGREQRMEVFMVRSLGAQTQLQANVMYRDEPGHVRGAPGDWLGAIAYERRF